MRHSLITAARLRRLAALGHAFLIDDPRRRGIPLRRVNPCYWVVDCFGPGSVIVDIGLGFDADFSVNMVAQFPVRSLGFDPTQKHAPALAAIARASDGRFEFTQAAVSTGRGPAEFHESIENVSGSLLGEHPNVARREHRRYSVQTLPLGAMLDTAGPTVDLVKMDVEGSEFSVLDASSDDTLRRAKQWVVEFHHGAIPPFRFADTKRLLRRFRALGYRAYTRDNVNFLLYRPELANRAP
jgi:FkbM family methyltransferase